MAANHKVANVVFQIAEDWSTKVIQDQQDFWTDHPELLDRADEVNTLMERLYQDLLNLEG